MMAIRDDDRVRLVSRDGVGYARRFPWIVEAACKRRQRQFIIDGEAVLLVFHGTSDFDGLHSCKYNERCCSSMPSTSWHWMATAWDQGRRHTPGTRARLSLVLNGGDLKSMKRPMSDLGQRNKPLAR
jgi:hypothetical protein